MKQLAFGVISALIILSPTIGLRATDTRQRSGSADDPTVYVTQTGSKYHRDGCRYLSQSKIPMKLSEAARRYEPCSICKPPVLQSATPAARPAPKDADDPIVYVTKTGSKYHRAGCRYLSKSAIPMKLSEASKRYGACSICKPPVRKAAASVSKGPTASLRNAA